MSVNLSRSAQTRKIVIETEYGVVAAQHRLAAEAGAAVLEAGVMRWMPRWPPPLPSVYWNPG